MKKIIFFLCLLVGQLYHSKAQYFEGKIVYNNVYQSKLPLVSNEQLSGMMGSEQIYYIKGGKYLSEMNGAMAEWQLYLPDSNKIFMKFKRSEAILWNDASLNNDTVISFELNKNESEVMGYLCDELILTCVSGLKKYYFNSNFALDESLFSNHAYGNWYDMAKLAKALPLKMIINQANFEMIGVAVAIEKKEISDDLFLLPEGAKLQKSPF